MKRIILKKVNTNCYEAVVLHDTFTKDSVGVLVEDTNFVVTNSPKLIKELCKMYSEYAVILSCANAELKVIRNPK